MKLPKFSSSAAVLVVTVVAAGTVVLVAVPEKAPLVQQFLVVCSSIVGGLLGKSLGKRPGNARRQPSKALDYKE